ncbi:MAG: succinylglutamate desuccinylase/aspartoacylase family protein, partial [Lysobacterales bacterium]
MDESRETMTTLFVRHSALALLFSLATLAGANEVQPAEESQASDLLGPQGFESGETTPSGTPFELLGQEIPAGQRKQLNWEIEAAMGAVATPTPILVAHGKQAGPVLCLTAAVHGDELNGVEVVRRILFEIKPEDLVGTVIGIPIANASGYLRGSRYLPDRRDLNRFFPGSASGSLASRFAKALFDTVIKRCSALVDMHTGSFQRINLPQLRADLTAPPVAEFSKQFGAIAVLHGAGPKGSLRRAATDVGIPAVTLEAGEAGRFDEESVGKSVEAIQSLLNQMTMVPRFRLFGEPQPAFYESQWVRANSGGILFNQVALGETVKAGQLLGTITDPIRNDQTLLKAPFSGRVLGMAVNQVVMPGFASYHVGRLASQEEA